MTTVAGGVEGCGGFGDVLADNRHVADLGVSEAGSYWAGRCPRVVCGLRLLEGASVEGNRPRLFRPAECDSAFKRHKVEKITGGTASRNVSGGAPTALARERSP